MPAVVGSIAAELLIDRSKFDAGLGRAGVSAKRFETDTRASLGRVDRAFSSTFSNVSKGAASAAVAALSLTAAIGGIRAAFDRFGAIADQSAAAGLDAEFFQGIAYQSSLAGVEIDALAGALAGFAKNAGLAAEGKGKMVSTLQALDPILLRNIQNASTQEARFRLVADALRDSTSAAQAAAIASAAFGDQGPKIVAAFRGGAEEIDAMARKAKDLGLIVNNDLIARADALGDEFDTVTQILDVQMKSALVEIGPVLVGLTGMAADLAKELREAVAVLQDPSEWIPYLAGTTGPESRLKKTLSGLRQELAIRDTNPVPGYVPGNPLVGAGGTMPGGRNDVGGGALQKDLEALFGIKLTAKEATKEVGALFDTLGSGAGTFAEMLKEFGGTTDKPAGGGRTGVAATFNDIGLAATEATPPVDRLSERFELLQQIGQTAIGGIVNALSDGKIEAQEFGDVLQSVANQLLNSGLNSLISGILDGFGGGFGTLGNGIGSGATWGGMQSFLRSFDGGGFTGMGARTGGLDGLGGFPAILHPNETVIDHTKGQGASGHNISISINGSRQDAAVIAREVRRVLPDAIQSYDRNPMRRA